MGMSVSRWTPAYFAAALISFALAQLLIVSGYAAPWQSWAAPSTLVVVHLLTIGWLTLLMLGALHQFIPVLTVQPSAGTRAAVISLFLIATGLALMIFGFINLGRTETALLRAALPLGGGTVVVGAVTACLSIGFILWRARPLSLPARFVAAGLIFFVITVGMGTAFALAINFAGWWPAETAGRFVSGGFAIHVSSGLGGWFTLTAMGVAYKLLSMFALAPEDRGAVGDWVFRLTTIGFSLQIVAGSARIALPSAGIPTVPSSAQVTAGLSAALGWLLIGMGIALYLYDMFQLYRERSRGQLELNARFAIWALAALAASLALLPVTALAADNRVMSTVVYLVIFGWLSGLGLSQIYKIVPFLAWLQHYGPRLGQGPVPRVQDLVDETRDHPWFVVYFAGVVLGALCLLAGYGEVLRGASALTLAATVVLMQRLMVVWLEPTAAAKKEAAPIVAAKR